jgi:hypothetical protein
MPTAQSARPDWKLRIELIVIAVVVASVVLAILAVAPVQHSYSEQFSSSYLAPAAATLTFPRGSQVSGSWATGDGGSASFIIVDSSQSLVYSSSGPNGTYSFTAGNPPYTFAAESEFAETVYAWGTYSAPLL